MALSTAALRALDVAMKGIGNAEELASAVNNATTSIGSASATDLAKITGVTNGTSAANKALVADASGNILINGFLYQSFVDTITAQHTSPSQSTATQLTGMINRITTVTASGDAVALPASVAGLEVQIINHGANPVQVYGNNAAADKINDVATGTGVSQMQGSSVVYSCVTAGNWYAEDLGVGYSGQYPTNSSADNITAQDTAPSQTTATALTSVINRVVTVATGNDAVGLPQSAAGMQIIVINAHASNALKVYTALGGDVINALSSSTGFVVAATKTCTFYCATAGQWHTLLSA